MTKLSASGREQIASNIMELGNLTFLGLVISQVIPGPPKGFSYAIIGFALWVFCYLFAVIILKRGIKL